MQCFLIQKFLFSCPESRVQHQLMRLPIIETENGFNTSIKVFRFDGSRRVRIRCSVNICVEKCKPVCFLN